MYEVDDLKMQHQTAKLVSDLVSRFPEIEMMNDGFDGLMG